jgi:hypothetical protein
MTGVAAFVWREIPTFVLGYYFSEAHYEELVRDNVTITDCYKNK